MHDLTRLRSLVRRRLGRHRRLLAAAAAAGAAAVAISVLSPTPPEQAAVVVAAHDLAAGEMLSSSDLRIQRLPPALVPSHAARTSDSVVGRLLAGPMRAGEVVTDRRLVGSSVLSGYPAGTVAAPVRISDAATLTLLRVGDRIDVYAAVGTSRADPTSPAALVVAGVPVIGLPASTDTGEGGLVILAVDQPEAAVLAEASATAPLSVTIRR